MPSSKAPETSPSSSVSLRGVSFWRTSTRLDPGEPGGRLPRFFRDNGLTIVAFTLFVVAWVAQAYTGWHVYADEHRPIGFWAYLRTWHFLEATMENWESEFLQMGVFVVLTGHLFQRGSAESKDPDDPGEDESRPHPWLYEHSLSVALFTLFFVSMVLHALGGWGDYAEDHPGTTFWAFVTGAEFWFQSMQNWQSEFLSVGALTVLSIFLRERGSSQSKPVEAPNEQTGEG